MWAAAPNAVNAKCARIAGFSERAIANQTSTEERRGGDIIKCLGEMVAKFGICQGKFGVSSIKCVASEPGLLTEIFSIRTAISALATGPSQPWDSNAFAKLKSPDSVAKLLNAADDFVAGNQGQFRFGQFAIDDVQIGSAYGARSDAHKDLFRTPGSRSVTEPTRPAVGEGPRGPSPLHGSFFAQKVGDRNKGLFGSRLEFRFLESASSSSWLWTRHPAQALCMLMADGQLSALGCADPDDCFALLATKTGA